MHKLGKFIIGGIQNKIFNLVLVNIVFIVIAYTVVLIHSSNDLTKLVSEANEKQEESMRSMTDQTMDAVVNNTMQQTTVMEAYIADDVFSKLKTQVEMLGEYATKLLNDKEIADETAFALRKIKTPDKSNDGKLITQLFWADNKELTSNAVAEKYNRLAAISDIMCSLVSSSDVSGCFLSVPEGFSFIADTRSASKYNDDGTPIVFNGTERAWYKGAVEAGGIFFSEIEYDKFTLKKEMLCTIPIYVNGKVEAVIGCEIFLDAFETGIESVSKDGGMTFIVNNKGHVVFSPDKYGKFKAYASDDAKDLREDEDKELAGFITDVLNGNTDVKLVTVEGKQYYMCGSNMGTVGWALVSMFDKEITEQPANMLVEGNNKILNESRVEYENNIGHTKKLLIIILIVLFLIGITNSFFLAKKIVKPLNAMAERVTSLGGDDLAFKMEDTYRTGDEIEVLAENFEALSLKTLNYIDQVKKVTAEKERIGAELNVATQIQADMLPRIFPPFPDRKEFDLFASMNPAKEVGGDFYDYFLIDDDHIALVMADVSGKGVPAALFMVIAKTLIKNRAQMGGTPSEILADVNDQLCEGNEAELFVTCWFAVIEISTGKGWAANAGHEHPALKHKDGQFELITYKHSPALAVMPGIPFRQHEFELKPGDVFFVYTDGVAEATDAKNELFGSERMINVLNREPDAKAKKLVENMAAGIEDFVEDAPQFDDITMLCFEYFGNV
jgi:sigma-B regulation protein RsbU (phosphoserine phosphatase)